MLFVADGFVLIGHGSLPGDSLLLPFSFANVPGGLFLRRVLVY